MENNRKSCFSYEHLWKFYILLNIPSFEHSAVFDWQHYLFSPVATSGCCEKQNCLYGTLCKTNRFQHKSKNNDEEDSSREIVAVVTLFLASQVCLCR